MELERYFSNRFDTLPASNIARAYLTGLFSQQAFRPIDFSDESVVLQYADIRQRHDLERLQRLADWIMWVASYSPESIADHLEVTESIGRASYYRCYRLVPGWRVYEELADNLPLLSNRIHCLWTATRTQSGAPISSI